MTKCAQLLEPNKELEFFTSYISLVIVTEEAKRTAPKDHLFYPLLYYFPKYLQLGGCNNSQGDCLNGHSVSRFLFHLGNIYVSSPTVLKRADLTNWRFFFVCFFAGLREVSRGGSRYSPAALEVGAACERVTRDALTPADPPPPLAPAAVPLPHVPGVEKPKSPTPPPSPPTAAGAAAFPAEKRVLPLGGEHAGTALKYEPGRKKAACSPGINKQTGTRRNRRGLRGPWARP